MLVLVSTQLVPQAVKPPAQASEQMPIEQTWGAAQIVPHTPQLFPSSLVFVHPAAQAVSPAWH